MWLDRPGMSPMLAGASVIDTKASQKAPGSGPRAYPVPARIGFAGDLSRHDEQQLLLCTSRGAVKAVDPSAGLSAAIYTTATLIARAQGREKRKLTGADTFTADDQISIGTAARIIRPDDLPGRAFWRLVSLQVNRVGGQGQGARA
jgi:hypothetical protein